MPSYVISGVSRGLGWEFLNQISSDPNNTVIGLVRDKPATDKRVADELPGRSNITILQADLTSHASLKRAATDASKITGGRLDYLIANGGYLPLWDAFDGLGTLADQPDEFRDQFQKLMNTNVLGNVYLYSLFLPQILNGETKKVLHISSGHADIDLVNNYDIEVAGAYAAGKAAMNMINAKFSAQYKAQGVLFLSICPGMVDTGFYDSLTPEQQVVVGKLVEKFKVYSPTFKGPDTMSDSIAAVLSVLYSSSIENGSGGAYLSHFGTKQWI